MKNTIPYALGIEKAYLGAILLDPQAKYKAPIDPEAFYEMKHRQIYSAMLMVESPDVPSLKAYFDQQNIDIPASYLVGLTIEVASSSKIKQHAEILQEYHLRRKLLEGFEKWTEKVYSEDLQLLITEIKHTLLQTKVGNNYESLTNPDLIESWFAEYDKPPKFIKTGIYTIDSAIGGFTPTDFGLILADTNVGKSTMLLNMAVQMALAGKHVLFFSLEMTASQLNDKFIAIYGKHNAQAIRNRITPKSELESSVSDFSALPITVIHKGAITSQDVVSEAYNRRLSGQVDIVMVDYVQRLSDHSKESETIKMKTIAQNLKNFALTNEIPVITPAQVDKASSQGGKIKVENVAWAKALADEADTALYLYEVEKSKGGGMLGSNFQLEKELRCRVVKSRHSEKGQDFVIDFDRITLRMEDTLGEMAAKFK